MSIMPFELERMVIQRCKATSLKDVSRVNPNWRHYIENNMTDMRVASIRCVNICNPIPMFITNNEAGRYEMGTAKRTLCTLDKAIKYGPFTLLSMDKSDPGPEKSAELIDQLNALPDWWIKTVTTLEMPLVNRSLITSFISRFIHIHHFNVRGRNVEELTELIEKAPRVDQFYLEFFKDDEHCFDDGILDIVQRKSCVYPTEFPECFSPAKFTLKKVIRFLELNNFVEDKQVHKAYMDAEMWDGDRRDWLKWLRANTRPTNGRHPKLTDEISKFKFQYKGMQFSIKMIGFGEKV